jgi:hypothetical protein
MLRNPYDPEDELMNFVFTAYAATTQMLEDVINALAREPDPNDIDIQRQICYRYGLNLDFLTDGEIAYVEREVARKWHGK